MAIRNDCDSRSIWPHVCLDKADTRGEAIVDKMDDR